MRIKYVSEQALAIMRENPKSLFNQIFINNQDLDSFVGSPAIYELPAEYPEIQFKIGEEDKATTDIHNIIMFYDTLKDALSDSLASDERIWVGMIFSEAQTYMKYRWPVDDYKKMQNRYFFAYSGQRALFRNGLSRLWWIGRLTYEEGAEDPYCRTKYLVSRQDIIETFCGRSIFNNKSLLKTTLSVMQRSEEKGISFSREFIRDIAKYLNMLSGVYIIDAIPPEDIAEKIENFILTNNERYL